MKTHSSKSFSGRLARLSDLARALLVEIAAARRARIATQRTAAIEHRRLREKQRIGFEALGNSIRNTTGNHGRLKPRY